MLKKVLGGVAGLAFLAGCGSQTIEERIVEATENEPNWEVECQHAIDIWNDVLDSEYSTLDEVIIISEDVLGVCEGIIPENELWELEWRIEDMKGIR